MATETNNNETRVVTDMFGTELKKGDKICFCLNMRKDDKPLVKAVVGGFIYSKTPDWRGVYWDWIAIDHYETMPEEKAYVLEWAENEKKLVKKVMPSRVVKCY